LATEDSKYDDGINATEKTLIFADMRSTVWNATIDNERNMLGYRQTKTKLILLGVRAAVLVGIVAFLACCGGGSSVRVPLWRMVWCYEATYVLQAYNRRGLLVGWE
jgi:hypothetical protein